MQRLPKVCQVALRHLWHTFLDAMPELGAKFCRDLDRFFALGIDRHAVETLCRKGDAELLRLPNGRGKGRNRAQWERHRDRRSQGRR